MSARKLPISVTAPVNPILATAFASHHLSSATIRELSRLGIYYLADAVLPGTLLWLSESTHKEVDDLLEKFNWPKFHLDRRHDPDTCEPLFRHLPGVILQQNSLAVPIGRELADLTGCYGDQHFGPPTLLALALLPRMRLQEALLKQLDALLERCGLHQQVTLDEVFTCQPQPSLTRMQIMQLTLNVIDMKLDESIYTWILDRAPPIPQAIDALVAMLAVRDPPRQLVAWFTDRQLPVDPLSSADLELVIAQTKIRD